MGNIVSPTDTTPRSSEQTHQGVAASTKQAHGCLISGNCSEDISCILEKAPFKKSWAYLQVSKHINKSKLSWNKDGIVHGVRYQDGNLVIQFPGWYVIICQLQFLVRCPEHSVDLKLELLINKDVKKQTLVTVCESGAQTKNIYQNLSQFLLEHLQVNTTISVKVDKFQYVDTNTFPLENVLSIFLYRALRHTQGCGEGMKDMSAMFFMLSGGVRASSRTSRRMAENLGLGFGETASVEMLPEEGSCTPKARGRLAARSSVRWAFTCCLVSLPILAGLTTYLLVGQLRAQGDACVFQLR
ncbi:hypothetical protein GH733_011291 [Mirounga leonina]|nr:hypothetical protein GH733_011291 [Mirounga leonina]